MCQVILTTNQEVVKGYHECPFAVDVGERFVAQKKKGDRGNALKVIDTIRDRGHDRGQLWKSMTIDDNGWQSLIIDDSRRQLKNTNFGTIDWSSISDINRLIFIDCHRLPSIVIDYRFHRLTHAWKSPGTKFTTCKVP